MNRNPQNRHSKPARKSSQRPDFLARNQQHSFQWLLDGMHNMPLRLQEGNSPAGSR